MEISQRELETWVCRGIGAMGGAFALSPYACRCGMRMALGLGDLSGTAGAVLLPRLLQ